MRKFILILIAAFSAVVLNAGPTDVVCGPWISDVSQTSFTVNWITEGVTLSWVEAGVDDGTIFYSSGKPRYYQTFAGKRVTGTKHSVVVSGLAPGESYIYRVCNEFVQDESDAYNIKYGGHKADGRVFRVRTLDPNAADCRFSMVNDIHGREDLFSDLTRDLKPSELDFFIVNGDIVSTVDDIDSVVRKCVNPIQKLVANVPYMYSRGNHEGRGKDFYKMGELFPARNGGWYYTFRQGPVAVIVLDAGEDKPDTDVEYFGLAQYDDYRETELDWLKRAVKEEEIASAPVKICLMHIPATKNKDSWYGEVWAYDHFVPVLNEAGVNLMLSGHLHEHRLFKPEQEGRNFPVLSNSNEERLDVFSDGKKIKVEVRDRAGALKKTYEF